MIHPTPRRRTLAVLLTLTLLLPALAPAPCAAEKKASFKLGICTSPNNLNVLDELGYQYGEGGLSSVAQMSEEDFAKLLKTVADSKVKIEAMNGFMPKDIKVTGPAVDNDRMREYFKKALGRADRLGATMLVFGSSGSRNVPDGFPKDKAMDQLVAALRLLSDEARAFPRLVIVIEPLSYKESNIINTVREGAELARTVDRPNIQLLADFYHMAMNKEEIMESIVEAGPLLRHCHIANPEGRVYPKPADAAVYKDFFAGLKKIGYQGRVSIEGRAGDFKQDARESLPVLRELAGN